MVILKTIISFLFFLILYPFKKLIPKENIIVMGTFNRQIYRENTRYLFEYMSEQKKNKIYWITDNKLIKKYLRGKKYRYISSHSIIHMIWVLLRTKIIVDSGTAYFNPFKLLDNGKTVKITTLHGNGPKANFSRNGNLKSFSAIEQIQNYLKFDYINYPSDYSLDMVGKKSHLIPNNKLINLGYPRCDQFFDQKFVNSKFIDRSIVKSIFDKFKTNSKIIFYTPTWRPYKFEFPLLEMRDFCQKSFNQWLEEKDFYFIYSSHTTHRPKDFLLETERVHHLNNNDNPFIDINSLMLEIDILLNDYSTTSTEFAILNRPQIFFMPDYNKYLYEKGFVEDYRSIMPGNEIESFPEFQKLVENIFDNPGGYLNKHERMTKELVKKYYDLSDGTSSKKFSGFIEKLLLN